MEAFTFTAGYLRTGPAESAPAGRKTGACLIFIRRALHMPKKQTPSGSREKERPPWQAAVFRGGS